MTSFCFLLQWPDRILIIAEGVCFLYSSLKLFYINGFTQSHLNNVGQTTTRYAGVHKKLYKKITFHSTIRLLKSIVKKKGDFKANKTNSLSHTKWMCKYHIVFVPKYRRKAIYAQYRQSLQAINPAGNGDNCILFRNFEK